MTSQILEQLYEHNNWANRAIIAACAQLSDEQLDAHAKSVTKGSIRFTLWHLMAAQQRYLTLLTGMEPRFQWEAPPPFAELQEAANVSGAGLLRLARQEPQAVLKTQFRGKEYSMEPWVVMLQAITHATEHREQIKSMLTALGVPPPELEGWTYGDVTNAITPVLE
jgi:uncharacterized damage-inducible protein DinB